MNRPNTLRNGAAPWENKALDISRPRGADSWTVSAHPGASPAVKGLTDMSMTAHLHKDHQWVDA